MDSNYIQQVLEHDAITNHAPNAKVIWIGNLPSKDFFVKSKKGQQWEMASLKFSTKSEDLVMNLSKLEGE